MSEIKKYSELEKEMNAYEAECKTLVFDYNDPKGNEDARSLIFKGKKINAAIEKTRKALKAKSLEEGRLVDSTAKTYTEKHQLSIAIHRDPVEKLEAEEKEKIAKIAEANKLKAEIEDAEREAYLEKGELELAAQQKALQDKADELKAAEDKLAEDKRVADAAEQARIDEKAKAKQDAKDAADKAEREQKEAVAKVEREAKETADKIEADRVAKEQADLRELNRLADIEHKRIADAENREEVENEAVDAILGILGCLETSNKVIDAIKDGNIPHISIQY